MKNEEKKKSISELLTKRDWYIIAGFFVIVFSILIYTFFTPNYYEGASPRTFEIRRGQSLNSTIDSLYRQGIIPSKRNMRIAAFLVGGERSIKMGRYRIPNGLSYTGLLDMFISGKREIPEMIDIFPGINIYQLAGQLQAKIHIDSAEVIRLAKDEGFLRQLDIQAPSVEGYLLPGVYYFYDRTSAAEVFTKIRPELNNFLNDTLKQRLKELNLTLNEVLTVASLIEGESPKKEEHSIIAGVYYNRLKRGMRLQADPTVQYSRMGKWTRLYYKDLSIDSPYNTYRVSGLPPGPINNPGKSALRAAFYPASHNYIYFVADGKGGHKFSSNYSDHLKLTRQYRTWLKNQK